MRWEYTVYKNVKHAIIVCLSRATSSKGLLRIQQAHTTSNAKALPINKKITSFLTLDLAVKSACILRVNPLFVWYPAALERCTLKIAWHSRKIPFSHLMKKDVMITPSWLCLTLSLCIFVHEPLQYFVLVHELQDVRGLEKNPYGPTERHCEEYNE